MKVRLSSTGLQFPFLKTLNHDWLVMVRLWFVALVSRVLPIGTNGKDFLLLTELVLEDKLLLLLLGLLNVPFAATILSHVEFY